MADAGGRYGFAITVAPGLSDVTMGGVSVTVYPGNVYVSSQPTVTFTGMLGFGASVQGVGKPISVEGVVLTPGTAASDTLGKGYMANVSLGAVRNVVGIAVAQAPRI